MAEEKKRCMVRILVELEKIVEVEAVDETEAEEIVNARWIADEIKLADLAHRETKIDCTYVLD